MSANDKQVGGEHYKEPKGVQHWDFATQHNMDYFQGQITKYICRWKKKNGIQDLEKAQHFLEKYIEVEKCKKAAGDPEKMYSRWPKAEISRLPEEHEKVKIEHSEKDNLNKTQPQETGIPFSEIYKTLPMMLQIGTKVTVKAIKGGWKVENIQFPFQPSFTRKTEHPYPYGYIADDEN